MTATSTLPERCRQTTPPAARTSGSGPRRGMWLLAAVGQSLHEQLLDVVVGTAGAYPLTVLLQIPRRGAVVESGVEEAGEVCARLPVRYHAEDFDASVEVAMHQVRGPDPVLRLTGTAEVVDPRVLEEPAEDRADPDVLGQPRHAGSDRAERAHQQVDTNAGDGRAVQGVDRL